MKIDPTELCKLLRYDPETGKLFWLRRSACTFQSERASKIWNTRFEGVEAGAVSNFGYRRVWVDGRHHVAHRIVWAMVYGVWPENEIDHVNGHRADNRLANLRSVTRSQNMQNRKLSVKNTSGQTGVFWFKPASLWAASIHVGGRKLSLGYFHNFDAAVIARKAAEVEHDYHPNHGRNA